MDKAVEKAIRDVVHMPEGEVLRVWSLPGIVDCPLAQQGREVANCPLGFDHRAVPSQPEPWMRGLCEDDSWKQRWRQILTQCELCRGEPRLSDDEAQRLQGIQESLFRRRETT